MKTLEDLGYKVYQTEGIKKFVKVIQEKNDNWWSKEVQFLKGAEHCPPHIVINCYTEDRITDTQLSAEEFEAIEVEWHLFRKEVGK